MNPWYGFFADCLAPIFFCYKGRTKHCINISMREALARGPPIRWGAHVVSHAWGFQIPTETHCPPPLILMTDIHA